MISFPEPPSSGVRGQPPVCERISTDRWPPPNGGIPFPVILLLLLAASLLSGCAATGRETARERELRRAVLEDRSFTVEEVPAGAPAHKAASLRLAAEGVRALRAGRAEEAEEWLEKGLSLDPRNPFCYLYLAEVRYREGETRQAIILLHQAGVQFQGHPYWLGEVYTREGRYWESLGSPDEARSAYRKALEHNPWNEESRQKLE